MKKRKKAKRRRIDVCIDVNIAISFYQIVIQRRVILRRAIEGVLQHWATLPVEEQTIFVGQKQQLVGADMAIHRRISSLVVVEVADKFFQQVEDYGCSIKDGLEAAVRCWINLPAKKQVETIRREKKH